VVCPRVAYHCSQEKGPCSLAAGSLLRGLDRRGKKQLICYAVLGSYLEGELRPRNVALPGGLA